MSDDVRVEEPKRFLENFHEEQIRGAKRANIMRAEHMKEWWVGYGKNENCQFEGSWWDMICFARNILASENTKEIAPEFYKPEWKNDNY